MLQNTPQAEIAEAAKQFAAKSLAECQKLQKERVAKIRAVKAAYTANGSRFGGLEGLTTTSEDDQRGEFRKMMAEERGISARIDEIKFMDTAYADEEAAENQAHAQEIREGAPTAQRAQAPRFESAHDVYARAEKALCERLNRAAGLDADTNVFRVVAEQGKVRISGPLSLLIDPVNVHGNDPSLGGGFSVYPPMSDLVVPGVRPPLMAMDITPRLGVSSNAFKYRAQQQSSTEQLKEAGGDTGATKTGKRGWKDEGATSTAEANYLWEEQTATIETIFGFTQATLEQLADEPQVQGLILQQLRMDLRRNLELALLHGSGANNEPAGLFSTGASTVDHTAPASGESNYGLDFLAMGIYDEVYNDTFLNVTAILMNAIDWRKLTTTRDENGNLQFMDPQDVSAQRVLGIPVYLSQFAKEDRTAGTVLMGSFPEGARLLDRQDIMIAQTDSDGTNFRSGNTTFRGHARIGVARLYAGAFCSVTTFEGKKTTA